VTGLHVSQKATELVGTLSSKLFAGTW
jgi:hypothetical protein